MISVDVRGMARIEAALREVPKQMPYILMSAINSTAFAVRKVEQAEMKTVFDNPAPWLLRQTRVQMATKDNLEAIVNFETPKAQAILTPHVTSGLRGRKPYELVLQRIGALPPGMRAVPASGIRKTASGDPSRTGINALIKGLQVKGSGFFAIKSAGKRLHPGVWFKTKRGKVKPHLLFVAQAAYRERFDFTGVGEKEVRRVFAVEFEKAWSKAIDTGR